jgi:hypothetical protein
VSNPDLIELAMRVVQQTSTKAVEHNPVAAELPASPKTKIEPTPPALPSATSLRAAPAKETKSPDELAAMILDDLSQIEGFPKGGVKVAVYGSNPWNSWLSFGGEAGPVPNKADLQGFCDFITERLKRLYDVAS